MGRRRERTKWSQIHWQPDKRSGRSGERRLSRGHRSPGEERSNSEQKNYKRSLSLVAPRFARNFAAVVAETCDQAQVSRYQGSGVGAVTGHCSIEELPDGFTKIRSKNLDILFKREYYEKRMMELENRKVSSSTIDQVDAPPGQDRRMRKVEVDLNDNNLANSTSIQSQVALDQLDIDEIPEFRPRQLTGESINDSGYSSSFQESFSYDQLHYQPPHYQAQLQQPQSFLPPIPMSVPPPPPPQHLSQFYLYSPACNTLIPCEEVVISQTIQSQEGQVYQNETKAYVAYPVQGPEGRGYITQPFAPPPNYCSGSEKVVETNEEVNDHVEGVVPLKLESSPSHPMPCHEDVRSNKPTNAELNEEETTNVVPVYIPGLHPAMEKKVKKRRKKKQKTQSGLRKTFNSSSESETKEKNANDVEFRDNFDEEWLNYVPEPINEINLTDDLANSLLNPPTDDDFESSTIAKEIMNLVDTENEVLVQEPEHLNGFYDTCDNAIETNPTENSCNAFNAPTKSKAKNSKTKKNRKGKNGPIKNSSPVPELKEISTVEVSNISPGQDLNETDAKPLNPEVVEDDATVTVYTTGVKNDAIAIDEPADQGCIDSGESLPILHAQVEEISNVEVAPQQELVKPEDDLVDEIKDPVTTNEVEETSSHSRTRKKRNRGGKKIQERQRQRVMVVDEEVDIQNECVSLGEANQSQLNLDILYVKDLGQGMTRGMMDLGRLFHGYYVPPDRRDFFEGENGELLEKF